MKTNLVSPKDTMTMELDAAEEIGAVDDDASNVESGQEEELSDELIADIARDEDLKDGIVADPEGLGSEEVKPPKFLRNPGQPSKAEKEAHDALHVNYRSWCRYCVMGRGQHRPHLNNNQRNTRQRRTGKKTVAEEAPGSEDEKILVEDEDHACLPMISMDYCFMGSRNRPANRMPILIVRYEQSKWIMGYSTGKKGAVDWVVDSLVQDFANIGYGNAKIVIKTDQEDSIIALRNAIIEKRKPETVPKLSVNRDPQSHGEIEVAVKTWAGQFRTLKFHIEGETGRHLPMTSAATTWLIKWAANSINLYRVQAHGVTAHEAIGGRHCQTPICPFGEHIQWKRQPNGVNSRKAETEWFDGVFRGVRPISCECIVGSSDGIVHCRTIRRVIDSDRWSMEAIREIIHTAGEVDADRHGGAMPNNKARTTFVQWGDIGHGKDAPQDIPSGDAAQEEPGPEVAEQDEAGPMAFDIGDEDAAFELFGPDSEEELQDGPMSPHHDSVARASDGVRVRNKNGRVMFGDEPMRDDDRSTPSPLRRYTSNRRTIESDDEPNPDAGPAPSKRGRANEHDEEDEGDDSLNDGLMNELIENRKILSALLRGKDITEVYSPERITRACLKQNLTPGSSFDLTNGWDFTIKSHRDKAFQKFRDEKPRLLIWSPPCTYFSILQNLNLEIRDEAWKEKFRASLGVAKQHVRFCVILYKMQAREGRYWLHEHPRTATSWHMDEVQELLRQNGSLRVESEQCRFGLITTIKGETMRAKKPT